MSETFWAILPLSKCLTLPSSTKAALGHMEVSECNIVFTTTSSGPDSNPAQRLVPSRHTSTELMYVVSGGPRGDSEGSEVGFQEQCSGLCKVDRGKGCGGE